MGYTAWPPDPHRVPGERQEGIPARGRAQRPGSLATTPAAADSPANNEEETI